MPVRRRLVLRRLSLRSGLGRAETIDDGDNLSFRASDVADFDFKLCMFWKPTALPAGLGELNYRAGEPSEMTAEDRDRGNIMGRYDSWTTRRRRAKRFQGQPFRKGLDDCIEDETRDRYARCHRGRFNGAADFCGKALS